jgi:hypothetical protein
MLDRYDSSHEALAPLAERGSRLFLVTVRPRERLLLVAVLEKKLRRVGKSWRSSPNTKRARDITALSEQLGLSTRNLASTLRTPRALTREQTELLRAAADGTIVAKTNGTKKHARLASPEGRIGLKLLIEAAGTQIEDEYLDDLREKPAKLIARGKFSDTVQSIFSGAFDSTADTLPLLRELAPLADGKKVLARLERELKKGNDATSLANELVDAFAVSALDALATAIAALATGRDAMVPAAVRPFVPRLAKQVARIERALTDH